MSISIAKVCSNKKKATGTKVFIQESTTIKSGSNIDLALRKTIRICPYAKFSCHHPLHHRYPHHHRLPRHPIHVTAKLHVRNNK